MSRQEFTGVAGTAFQVELPPDAERPNPATVASLGRWNLTLPKQHPLWDRYTLGVVHLRDIEGSDPAVKHSPENTHEISVFAIVPDFPEEQFQAGDIQVLEPVNHVCQFVCPNDVIAVQVAEMMVRRLVDGQELAEPSGITGARDRFKASVAALLFNSIG